MNAFWVAYPSGDSQCKSADCGKIDRITVWQEEKYKIYPILFIHNPLWSSKEQWYFFFNFFQIKVLFLGGRDGFFIFQTKPILKFLVIQNR